MRSRKIAAWAAMKLLVLSNRHHRCSGFIVRHARRRQRGRPPASDAIYRPSLHNVRPLHNVRCSSRSVSLMAVDQNDESGLMLPRVSASSLSSPRRIRSVAAPMVAASDYAFRCLCRNHGVDLTYTQMLHAKNLVHDRIFGRNHLDLYECYGPRRQSLPLLDAQRNMLRDSSSSGVAEDDNRPILPAEWERATRGPVVVQLAGHDASLVARAAELVLENAGGNVDGIDLNLGCPQGIARKGNYGAFLMERDTTLACQILSQLRKNLPQSVSVSAKIRLPFDDATLADRIPRLIDTGINFMTIHGRTLEENKTKVRACHVDRIRLAVEIAQQHQPGFMIVANGGVESLSDVARVRLETGAVAVMSSEALLETPNLFAKDISALSPRQLLEQQFSFAREYMLWCRAYPPLPGVLGHDGGSFNVARGHLFKFLHRYLQENADVRESLASNQIRTLREATELIDRLYARYLGLTDDELLQRSSSQLNSSWYRRHWDANASLHIHQRHRVRSSAERPSSPGDGMSIEQRKEAIRLRIANLRLLRNEAL